MTLQVLFWACKRYLLTYQNIVTFTNWVTVMTETQELLQVLHALRLAVDLLFSILNLITSETVQISGLAN